MKNVSVINRKESAIEGILIKKLIREKYNVDWDSRIKPQIREIVIKTFQSCSSKMKHRERSFEIYGFDLMLDENLKPWLIEVNLSPACSERTQFLKHMLGDMTEHLFRILRRKEKSQTEQFNQDLNAYKKEVKAKKEKLKKLQEKEKQREKNYGNTLPKVAPFQQNISKLSNSIMSQSGAFMGSSMMFTQ